MGKDPKKLYQSIIMEHNRHPTGFSRAEDAEVVLKAYNPLCGDAYTLYLEFFNDRVSKARFHGYGCAISKASTSVLMENIAGATKATILQKIETMLCVANPDCALPDDLPDDFLAFAAAREFPARKTCVTLSWDTLAAYLGGDR